MNGASVQITAGNQTGIFHSSSLGHAEMNGLREMSSKGYLKGQNVIISDVTGKFSTGSKPVGVCSNCRKDMFEILKDSGAQSVQIPVTKSNVTQGSLTIQSKDFGTVQKELDKIKSLNNPRIRSDKTWDILKKDSNKCG